ncbi:MAG TPA: beta-propeller fold lactonase family protein, partial [Blastocatellia bacterium]
RAYVTAENGGTVTVVNAKTHRVTRTIELPRGQVKPMGIAISRDGSRLYVSNGRGNSVAVIDTRSNKILAMISVAQRPWGIALSADGRKIYTANGLSNDVAVIDTATNRVITTIRAGEGPWGIAISH